MSGKSSLTAEEGACLSLCLDFLTNSCVFAKNACPYVHSRHPFLWQFLFNHQWQSFPELHAKELEVAYREVNKDGVNLSHNQRNTEQKHFALQGSWYANFDTMTVEQGNTLFKIRRLSTASSALCNNVMSTEFEWFFKDERNIWIKYGKTNPRIKQRSATSTTSNDIEAYFCQNPDAKEMQIASMKHQYVIDFQNMTQTNRGTGAVRPLRRRVKKTPLLSDSRPGSGVSGGATATAAAAAPLLPSLLHLPSSLLPFPPLSTVDSDRVPVWQFEDENKVWVTYGQTSTAEGWVSRTTMTSKQVEEHFNNYPNSVLVIKTHKHTYELDFATMKQTNQKTLVQRRIRRILQSPLQANSVPNIKKNVHSRAKSNSVATANIPNIQRDVHSRAKSYSGVTANIPNIQRDVHRRTNTNSVASANIPNIQRDVHNHTKNNLAASANIPNIQRDVHSRIKNNSGASAPGDSSSSLPSNWSPMTPNSFVMTVPLNAQHIEFSKMLSIIGKTFANIKPTQMYRIQNPFLWNAYCNRRNYLKEKNSGINYKEKYLFHGTDSHHIKSICDENIDWRLHGTNIGQRFGRGSYFSNDAKFSAQYCRGSPRVLFVLKVLVGHMTPGDASMVRPPANSVDTAVDNMSSPKIFVKFDAQEYYPEYYVEFQL